MRPIGVDSATMGDPYRTTDGPDHEAKVTFVEPTESNKRSLPSLRGKGVVSIDDGKVVLRGKVYRLTAWWLRVGAPLLLFLTVPLFFALKDFGLWLGLSSVIGLVVADFVQRRRGRAYSLRVPAKCEVTHFRNAETTHVRLVLDRFVVNGGSRPPIVEFDIQTRTATRLGLTDVLSRR
jgi:hypothetical protein